MSPFEGTKRGNSVRLSPVKPGLSGAKILLSRTGFDLVLAQFRHKYLPTDPDCDLLITNRDKGPTEKTSEDPSDREDEDLDEQ